MKTIGFTGTQQGMTEAQKFELAMKLDELFVKGFTEFRHGDCIGADEQAHYMAMHSGWRIVIHPPINESKRAFCGGDNVYIKSPKPYLDRNHDIVDESDIMIATPYEDVEQLRSGTWATVRYARKKGKEVILILP